MLPHDAIARIPLEALDVVRGAALHNKAPFNGVGLKTLDDHRILMLTYRNGIPQGPYVEPLLNLGHDVVVDEGYLEYGDGDSIVFNDRPFTGWSAAIEDSRMYVEEVRNGVETLRRLAWHPDGSLAEYSDTLAEPEGHNSPPWESYLWHPGGVLKESRFYPLPRCGSTAKFDMQGDIVALRCSDNYLDAVTKTEFQPKEWVWRSVSELIAMRTGDTLKFGPVDPKYSESIVLALQANDGLTRLESLSAGYKSFSPESLERLLVPTLTDVNIDSDLPALYSLLREFKHSRPDARVVFNRVELRPSTNIAFADKEPGLQAHYYDPDYEHVVGRSQRSADLSDSDVEDIVGDSHLRFVRLPMPSKRERREALRAKAVSIKQQRPDMTVIIGREEIDGVT